MVHSTVEICLFLPVFAHIILNGLVRNARGNRGPRHFLTRPGRKIKVSLFPSIVIDVTFIIKIIIYFV